MVGFQKRDRCFIAIVIIAFLVPSISVSIERADKNVGGPLFGVSYYKDGDLVISPLLLTVARIKSVMPEQGKIENATGFFYEYDDQIYLITNHHVVLNEEEGFYPKELFIRVHTDESDLTKNELFRIYLYSEDSKPVWLEHPVFGPSVDVIAIPLETKLFREYFVISTFDPSDHLTQDDVFTVGENIIIMGFPLGFSDEYHNMPVIRNGIVASFYPVHFESEPYFLVDARLHGGTSGSPVLAEIGKPRWTKKAGLDTGTVSQIYLFGVHSDTLDRDYGREYVDESNGKCNCKPNDEEPLGLNQTWYAKLIPEIITQKTQ